MYFFKPTLLLLAGCAAMTIALPTSPVPANIKTPFRRGDEGVDVADGFKAGRGTDTGEGVDVADGFKLKREEKSGAGVDVADGFKLKREEESGAGVDVADGFKLKPIHSTLNG